MVGCRQLHAIARRFRGRCDPGGKWRHQEEGGQAKVEEVTLRPAFRVELKVKVRRADDTSSMLWLTMPDEYGGQTVECALAHAVDKAGDEVRRIASRPAYDLVGKLGADYRVINLRFVRTDVGDEDGE